MTSPAWARARHGLIIAVVAMLAVIWVLRYQIANDFTLLLSDFYDGLIESSLYEHWHRVLSGREHWNRPDYFYPYYDTLGYNDGFLLNGSIFTVLRVLGLDVLLARELTAGLIRLIGFVSFYGLSRVGFRFSFVPALLGATLFTVSNSLWIHGVHAQLITLDVAPLLVLLAWLSARGFVERSTRRSLGYGVATGLLYGAWLMTGFYMVWFFTLFSALAGVFVLLLPTSAPRRARARTLVATLWAMKLETAVVLATAVIALLPFLHVYLPKVKETGQHPWEEVRVFLPPLLAILHLGHGNLLYGGLDRSLIGGLLDIGENTVGLTPGVLLLATAGALLGARGSERNTTLLRALGLACLACIACTVTIDGASLWYWVFEHVPGAKGIRSVSRMILFLTFPTVLLCTHVLDLFWTSRRAVTMALGGFLLLEQVNCAPQLGLDRVLIDNEAARIGRPPATCRSFFSRENAPPPSAGDAERLYGLYHANTPAMYFAELLGIPSINGFSTFNPPDWELDRSWEPSYLGRVALYVYRHRIVDGLCELDFSTLSWNTTPFAALIPPPGDVTIDPRHPDPNVHFAHGWSLPESEGLWTDGYRAEVATFLRPDTRYDRVELTSKPFAPAGKLSLIRFYIDDRLVLRWVPPDMMQTRSVQIPDELQHAGYLRFRLDIVTPRSPKSEHMIPDGRMLGLFLRSIVVRTSRDP